MISKMDKRFSEMSFPEQLDAYESACAEVSRLKAQVGEYSRKLKDYADELIAWKEACRGLRDALKQAKGGEVR